MLLKKESEPRAFTRIKAKKFMRVKSLLEIRSLMLSHVFLSTTCFLIAAAFTAHAGGVRGFVKDEKGAPLAYTTIFVKQTAGDANLCPGI